eukprot:355017-Chlamydomonas_euryale.AAC.6
MPGDSLAPPVACALQRCAVGAVLHIPLVQVGTAVHPLRPLHHVNARAQHRRGLRKPLLVQQVARQARGRLGCWRPDAHVAHVAHDLVLNSGTLSACPAVTQGLGFKVCRNSAVTQGHCTTRVEGFLKV